jgi:hypothetical protein
VQAEGFTLAHTHADQQLAQVGRQRIRPVAVLEEAGSFLNGPHDPLLAARAGITEGRVGLVTPNRRRRSPLAAAGPKTAFAWPQPRTLVRYGWMEGERCVARNEHVAAFWRPLNQVVQAKKIQHRTLAQRLNLSASTVSDTLNGNLASAPDWYRVEGIVTACFEASAPGCGSLAAELAFWRRRLRELESALEAEVPTRKSKTTKPGRATKPAPSVTARCRICDDAYEDERFDLPDDVFDFWEFGFQEACDLLAGPDSALRADAEALGPQLIASVQEFNAFRDQCREIVDGLLEAVGSTVRQACRRHGLRLLHAAHTVVVVESFIRSTALDLVCRAMRSIVAGEVLAATYADGRLAAAPMPVANVPYTDHRERVAQHYADTTAALITPDNPWGTKTELAAAGADAAARYEARLGELAGECPELFVWASLQDGAHAAEVSAVVADHAGRRQLDSLTNGLRDQKRGLDGLETLLRALARRTTPSAWPAKLSEIYRLELARPISRIARTPDGRTGPRIPKLAQGYVNPAFRCAVYQHNDQPHADEWWRMQPLREEIQGFLAGHLSGLPIAQRPVVILGDPGAGKSLLTRLLAARLPPTDYLPIRIELRDVPADASILDQIAHSLRAATLSKVHWSTVTEASPDVLPVLIFDGFDELLQAGGADHWRYLEEIEEFQRTSADNGRPVAAIVTSRTVVADQAKIPDGSLLLRLEPFDADRIGLWVDTWNTANGGRFAPLPRDMGRRHPELVVQPLLLLMLAIYYAVEGDGDTEGVARLSRVELYEKLMQLFARRQVTKLTPGLRPEALASKVETELDHLAVIAAAMFNRGRQGVTAEEAEHDLGYLCTPGSAAKPPDARKLFGRFFFIHEAKSTFGKNEDRRWYEFLHATFGEYLVARKIAATLKRCPDGGPYEDLLFDLLAFAPLTDRLQVLSDLRELLQSSSVVADLYGRALLARPGGGSGYTTGFITVTYQHACFSANLLLIDLAMRETVRFSELVHPTTEPAAQAWRDHATLWQSQFTANSWDAFTRAVTCVPFAPAPDGLRDVVVRLGRPDTAAGGNPAPESDLPEDLDGSEARRWGSVSTDETFRRVRILGDSDIDHVTELASAAYADFGELAPATWISGTEPYTAEQALIALLSCDPTSNEDLAPRLTACLTILDRLGEPRYFRMVCRKFAQNFTVLSLEAAEAALHGITSEATALRTLDHSTRTLLLACALQTVTRRRSTSAISAAQKLLDLDLATAPLSDVGGLLFNWMLDQAETNASESQSLQILLVAVELKQFNWYRRFANKVLSSLSDETLRGIPASYTECLLPSLDDPALAERVRRAAEWPA